MEKLIIGVDIGGTRTKIGLVDVTRGKIISNLVFPTEKKSAKVFEENIIAAVSDLKGFVSSKGTIEGIGVGVSGFVWENGTVDSTYGFIQFMEDYPLAEIFQRKLELPCLVDNDARTIALGEALYGGGKGYDRMLMVSLGTGVGLGFTRKGKLGDNLPYSHMAGHLTITENEMPCYCGKTGCFESLVSATGIVDAAVNAGWDELPDAKEIFAAARLGNPIAGPVIEQWLRYLKTGIDNYINIFAPDVIILGGGVAKELEFHELIFGEGNILRPFKSYCVKVCMSKLEEQAGILGSAALLMDKIDCNNSAL